MKQLNIQRITVEGFGSISAKMDFDLHRPGINIIKGPNGSGKTTMFNAIYWALYGKTSKNVSVSDIPTKSEYRHKGFKGTYVKIDAEIGGDKYTILRTYKSKHEFKGLLVGASDLLVYDHRQGINVTDDISIKDSQKVLDDILGIDGMMFANSVFFGQKTTRLMDTSEADKRVIFETILYSIIQDMDQIKEKVAYERAKNTDKKTKLSIDSSRLEGKREVVLNTITQMGSDIVKAEQLLESKLQEIDLRISGLREQEQSLAKNKSVLISRDTEYKKRKEELKKRMTALDLKYNITELEEKYMDVVSSKRAKESELSRVGEAQTKKIFLELGGRCYTCGSDITDQTIGKIKAENDHKIKEHKKVVRRLEKDIAKLEEQLTKFEGLSKLKAVKSDYTEKLSDVEKVLSQTNYDAMRVASTIKSTASEIVMLQERRAELIEKRAHISQEIKQKNIDLKEIEKEIKALEESVAKIDERISYLDWWSRVGLGSSGINTYLYESLLVSFNEALQKYSAILGIGVKLLIDKTKKSRPFLLECYDGEVIKSYESLSGGEQQRVNIGILFALYELVCSKTVETNLLLLDEVFEGLDEEGTTMVFQVLQTYANKSLYVITHNQDISADYVEFIDFTKEKGQTAYG